MPGLKRLEWFGVAPGAIPLTASKIADRLGWYPALVASDDELHQAFLRNRTGSVRDVMEDCAGAIALQVLVYLYLRAFMPRKLAHEL